MERDYTVPPGAYLEEWLEEEGMTQAQLGQRLGRSRKLVNQLVNGLTKLTPEVAAALERITGISSRTWLIHEAGHQDDLEKLSQQEGLQEFGKSVSAQLCTWMRKHGITEGTRRHPEVIAHDLLKFHGFGTPAALQDWADGLQQGDYQLAARKANQKSTLDQLTLSTWLRLGERDPWVEEIRSRRFSAEELERVVPDLRARCAQPDLEMLRDVRGILGDAGVALIVLEPPAGLPLHGVTRWIDRRTPVIQQTGRMKTDGFIIMTLFHEIGHILHDPRGELHLEYSDNRTRGSASEKRANQYAREVLFGGEGVRAFKGLVSDVEIRARATEVGVAPGVAVVEMRRVRYLERNYGHRLTVDLSSSELD